MAVCSSCQDTISLYLVLHHEFLSPGICTAVSMCCMLNLFAIRIKIFDLQKLFDCSLTKHLIYSVSKVKLAARNYHRSLSLFFYGHLYCSFPFLIQSQTLQQGTYNRYKGQLFVSCRAGITLHCSYT